MEFADALTITRLIAMQSVLLALCFGFNRVAKAAELMMARQLCATRSASSACSITAAIGLIQSSDSSGSGGPAGRCAALSHWVS
jgi:hypothetical protein